MAGSRLTGLIWVLLALAAPAIAAGRPTLELAVDCDRGDSLRAALRRAARVDVARIAVSGACTGNYRVTGHNYVEIRADPAGSAELSSNAGPIVSATGPGWLELHGLSLRGGTGVRASGDGRVVVLDDCEVAGDPFGVQADPAAGVWLRGSRVSGTFGAVRQAGAEVLVEGGRLHDSQFGLRAFGGRTWLDGVEISDNEAGAWAGDRADLTVIGSRFARNGTAHVSGTRDSRIELYNSSLGGPDDPTPLSFSIGGGCAVDVFGDDPATEIWGGANVHDDSYFSLVGTRLHGSMQLRDFSRLRLDGEVLRGVSCRSAADAWCDRHASASTTGCASAPQLCVPTPEANAPVAAPRLPRERPERFRPR